jgi:hypothetical protein
LSRFLLKLLVVCGIRSAFSTCHLKMADDQIVLDGDGYIFRSALAIFGFLEPRQVPIIRLIRS